MTIEHLEWDSNFFRKKIGKINNISHTYSSQKIVDILKIGKEKKYDLVYLFAEKNILIEDSILDSFNGRLMDEKIIFTGVIENSFFSNTDLIVQYEGTKITPELLELSYLSGDYSRYKLDNKFDSESFYKLYKIWIENSINGQIADAVFISCDENGRITAMVTVKKKKNQGEIGLIAVSKTIQGMGVGYNLIEKVKKYLFDNNIYKLDVATQLQNINACKFYKKCGLHEKSITNVYHFWI